MTDKKYYISLDKLFKYCRLSDSKHKFIAPILEKQVALLIDKYFEGVSLLNLAK